LVTVVTVLVSACSSGDGKQATPKTTFRTTVITTPLRTVPVSHVCRVAISMLVYQSDGGLDPFAKGPPSGMGAQVYGNDISQSLTRCKSRDEWLTAARDATRSERSTVYAFNVLRRYCGLSFSDFPPETPAVTPSCIEVPPASIPTHWAVGLKEFDVTMPIPYSDFGPTSSWIGVKGGQVLSVYAGDYGPTRPSEGAIFVLLLDATTSGLLGGAVVPVPSTGPLRITGVSSYGHLQLTDRSGNTRILDATNATNPVISYGQV